MPNVSLRLGPLEAAGRRIRRSGIRWLREEGHRCRAGEIIAYMRIELHRWGGPEDAPDPFAEEAGAVQIALATPVAGRLRQTAASSRGGFFDILEHRDEWTADLVFAVVETAAGTDGAFDADFLMLSGRRVTDVAQDRSGLLTGWHDRTRAWQVQGEGPVGTVISLGLCEMAGVMRGERFIFEEFFETIAGSAQAVFVPDVPLVTNARIIADQLRRTDADRAAISADLAAALAGGPVVSTPADWLIAGAVTTALNRSPLTEHYDVLGRDGLRRAGPPDAVILSLNAEWQEDRRHRRLGYSLQIHRYVMLGAGPAFTAWMDEAFEKTRRDLGDVQADYRDLIDLIRAGAPDTRILICNRMASSGYDDVQSYAPFDAPMSETLSSVRNKELNLMLHDLARERDICIVDVDAIGAEVGGRHFLPDGVHQGGLIQAEVRAEILRILRAEGVPGFGLR